LRAEALAVRGALADAHVLCDVEVHALVAVGAEAVLGKEPALWHLAQVVLVHELALVALFAQAAEPVLADGAGVLRVRDGRRWLEVEGRGGDVAERAGGAAGTWRRVDVVGTELVVGVEAQLEVVLEEGLDREVGVEEEAGRVRLYDWGGHGCGCAGVCASLRSSWQSQVGGSSESSEVTTTKR